MKRDLRYCSCHAVSKPRLTRAHIIKRLTFVSQHKDWDLNRWRRVLWSDEASFQVTDNQRNRVYRRHGSNHYDTRHTTQTVKHTDCLRVWGCFSYHGFGKLVFLPKNVRTNQNNSFELIVDELE